MSLVTHIKDPDEKKDYGFDWKRNLADGETISVSAWAIPVGLTEVSSQISDTMTVVWLSGGSDGTTYSCTNRVTTSEGRIWERSLDIVVQER